MQQSGAGAHCRRARFHSSMLDVRMLKKGQKFQNLKDSYVIFITKEDVMGCGLPVYHVERTIQEMDRIFGDGSHIIYVNGSYESDEPIGKLMHDFRCKNACEMKYSELSKGVDYFKNGEGGQKIVSELVEKYAQKVAREASKEERMKTAKARQEAKSANEKAKAANEKAKLANDKAEAARDGQVAMVRNLMVTMKWTLEQALDAMDVPESDRKMITKRI